MSYRHKHIKPKIRSLKKRKRLIQKPWFWVILLVLIIMGSIFYFVFFFPKFQVANIIISDNQNIQTKDIENIVWQDLNKNIFSKSIFIIDSKKLVKDILNKFTSIESVEVQIKLPDNIILKIKERELFAVFCADENLNSCFHMDKMGMIFKPLEQFSENNFIVRREENNEVFLGENIIEKNIIDIISMVEKDLKNNFQIDIREVFVSNPLIFKTSENWQIYFDPTSDVDLQITKMNILLKDKITINDRKNIKYIYLQYKDRAYYK